MRNPTYLTKSRHGVYHLRWRLCGATPTGGKPAYLKLSLGTRDPKEALTLVRMLTERAVSLGYGPGCLMRYDELRATLRTHFAGLLAEYKDRISATGPMPPEKRRLFQEAADFAQMSVETDSALLLNASENDAVTQDLIARYKLPIKANSDSYETLQKLYALAYRDFARSIIRHNDSYSSFEFDTLLVDKPRAAKPTRVAVSIERLATMHFDEAKKGGQWAGKTEFEKAEHIELLKELLGGATDVESLTLHSAREVKECLLRYPRNRRKNPRTRDLTLDAIMDLKGLQTINAQTVNKYLQTFGTMFEWGRKNGFVSQNVFAGLAIRSTKRAATERKAFSSEQVTMIYEAIVGNAGSKAKLPYQKWGPLIGLYSGARLNEIAQIHLKDIRQEAGIWYFDLNDDDEGKKLKTDASRRIVPVHPRLIELGLLEYVDELRNQRMEKLFPTFTYCTKNGWGRALGRWFNDKFLPELGMKNGNLVFHSLRHTVTNSLQREDVPQAMVQALIGHTRGDMLGQHYSAFGFKLRQLYDALLKLPY